MRNRQSQHRFTPLLGVPLEVLPSPSPQRLAATTSSSGGGAVLVLDDLQGLLHEQPKIKSEMKISVPATAFSNSVSPRRQLPPSQHHATPSFSTSVSSFSDNTRTRRPHLMGSSSSPSSGANGYRRLADKGGKGKIPEDAIMIRLMQEDEEKVSSAVALLAARREYRSRKHLAHYAEFNDDDEANDDDASTISSRRSRCVGGYGSSRRGISKRAVGVVPRPPSCATSLLASSSLSCPEQPSSSPSALSPRAATPTSFMFASKTTRRMAASTKNLTSKVVTITSSSNVRTSVDADADSVPSRRPPLLRSCSESIVGGSHQQNRRRYPRSSNQQKEEDEDTEGMETCLTSDIGVWNNSSGDEDDRQDEAPKIQIRNLNDEEDDDDDEDEDEDMDTLESGHEMVEDEGSQNETEQDADHDFNYDEDDGDFNFDYSYDDHDDKDAWSIASESVASATSWSVEPCTSVFRLHKNRRRTHLTGGIPTTILEDETNPRPRSTRATTVSPSPTKLDEEDENANTANKDNKKNGNRNNHHHSDDGDESSLSSRGSIPSFSSDGRGRVVDRIFAEESNSDKNIVSENEKARSPPPTSTQLPEEEDLFAPGRAPSRLGVVEEKEDDGGDEEETTTIVGSEEKSDLQEEAEEDLFAPKQTTMILELPKSSQPTMILELPKSSQTTMILELPKSSHSPSPFPPEAEKHGLTEETNTAESENGNAHDEEMSENGTGQEGDRSIATESSNGSEFPDVSLAACSIGSLSPATKTASSGQQEDLFRVIWAGRKQLGIAPRRSFGSSRSGGGASSLTSPPPALQATNTVSTASLSSQPSSSPSSMPMTFIPQWNQAPTTATNVMTMTGNSNNEDNGTPPSVVWVSRPKMPLIPPPPQLPARCSVCGSYASFTTSCRRKAKLKGRQVVIPKQTPPEARQDLEVIGGNVTFCAAHP